MLLVLGWFVRQPDTDRSDAVAMTVPVEAAIAATEKVLRDPESMRFAAVTPDSVTVTLEGNALEVLPHGRVLYYPLGARLGSAIVGGAPPDLVERMETLSQLASAGVTPEVRTQALDTRELLLDGRWRLSRATFEQYLRALSEWAAAGEPPSRQRLALSAAVESLWLSLGETGRAAEEHWWGRRFTATINGVPFTVLTQTRGTRVHALIAGPAFPQQQWKASSQLVARLIVETRAAR